MTTTSCICRAIPRDRAGQLIAQNNTVVYAFHLDCLEHGIKVLDERDMRKVYRRAWFASQDAWIASRREGATLIRKSVDGKSALIEWVEYEHHEKENTPEANLALTIA